LLPNTKSVSISPTSLHTLRIKVESHAPIFKINEKEAITKEAIVYTEIEDISNLSTLSFTSTSTITPDLISKIIDIIPKVSASIFEIKSININEYNDIYLQGNLNNKSSIILSETSDVKKVWSNLVSAIDTEPLKSKLIKQKDKLEYLDTRFGNKVFYKYK
jgi:hypothetical protein